MKTDKTIARVVTSSGIQFFNRLTEAFECGRSLNEPHKIEAKDVKGVWVCVDTWAPDCASESKDDTYGGVINNMWRENNDAN